MKKLLMAITLIALCAVPAHAGLFAGGGMAYNWTDEYDLFKNKPTGMFLGGLELGPVEVSVAKEFEFDALDAMKGKDWQGRLLLKFRF